MERYVCVHGHFYQPPRENPWLEAIELQDSAYPYHDWNQRIAAECYAPNGSSRILDEQHRIVKIINNYASMSFNMGPTLLAWMQAKAPETYEAVIEADKASGKRFAGHGSATAQAYNHMIMPLANRRDKFTQAVWGIRDFEHRFGRQPEGMWLPETAVDLESLDILAELGIRFTILAPHQARRVRPLPNGEWRDVEGAHIDPSTAYLQRLPSGRTINLFFYDGPASRDVAFQGLLRKGDHLAQRLLGLFNDQRSWPQLAHIATDGETYGHHHRFGDMALAFALDSIERSGAARLTNYGEFLEKHPPTQEVEIIENTSWSCVHGIERWRNDCGCNSGQHFGWNQGWRAPLRHALDWLRDSVGPAYEQEAGLLLRDPWAARDDYVDVILNRTPENVDAFLDKHSTHELDAGEQTRALKLLELQRHAMLMYTSCGWFFDELSGIETVQVIQYAGRVLQLATDTLGNRRERSFLRRLEEAKSNIPEHQDGRVIYEKWVKPAMVNLDRVGAHYAVSSIFEEYPEKADVYCYTFDRERQERFQAGRAGLIVGQARVTSQVTRETALLTYGALHFGDHNLNGGVRRSDHRNHYEATLRETSEAFDHADFLEVVRLMERHFGESNHSLRSLFRDEQRKVLDLILASTLADAEADYRHIYERNFTLMRFLADLRIPLPQGFRAAARFILTSGLRQALQERELDPTRIQSVLEEAKGIDIALEESGLAYLFEQALDRMIDALASHPDNLELLQKIEAVMAATQKMPFEMELRTAQNVYYRMLQDPYPRFKHRADSGDGHARDWVMHFKSLGDLLAVRVA